MIQIDERPASDETARSDQREQRIRQLGNAVLEADHPRDWTGRGWFQRLSEGMLRNEAFRIQVLRFVDVLPTLADDHELVSHLNEYFGALRNALPAFLAWALPKSRYTPALTARMVRRALILVAKRFIGGENAGEALETVRALRRQKLGFSLDLLGEAVVSEKEAEHYQAAYLRLLDDLGPVLGSEEVISLVDRVDGRTGPRLYLSLKLSSLYSQISPVNFAGSVEVISERLRPIFRNARKQNAFICIDMEQYEFKPIVLETFKRLLMEEEFRDWPDVGIAVQAYLRDSRSEIIDLIDWAALRGTPVTVRLVRGAYWDYETVIAAQHGWEIPVWTVKNDTDWNYEQCLELLLSRYPVVRTAIATHNLRSISAAMALAGEFGLAADQFEFQMLYGMASELQQSIPKAGYCLRVYVPFGEPVPGMAYLVRRLLENSSGQSLLLSGTVQASERTKALVRPEPADPPQVRSRESQHSRVPVAEETGLPPFVNEPLRRFVDRHEHRAMESAIIELRQNLGRHYPVVLNGRAVDTEACIESINPAIPDEIIGRVGIADVSQAERALVGAEEAFRDWSRTPVRDRAAFLIETARLLRERRERFAALEIVEAGKTWSEADANVTEAIDFLEFYAREAVRLDTPGVCNVPGENNSYGVAPLGVGVVIPPWNFPLAILTGMLSAAVVTGNTVVLKPSSQTPVIAAHFVNLLMEAGLPAGVVQFLPGPGAILGQYLVEHPITRFVVFTGSEEVGTGLIEAAARRRADSRNVKRVIAEMGGKNAIIVDRDAELDEAVNGIIRSAFGYQGQKCSACSRLIVVGAHYRFLVDRLVEAASSLVIGNPENPRVNFGPVIEQSAMHRIQKAIRVGCTVARPELIRDCSAQDRGFFVGPAIFSEVSRSSALFREEIFGPVLSVLRADDLDHALEIANDSVYALTGGFYSRSPSNIERVKNEFQVGNLYVNRGITGALVNRQPFGGFKMSGIGSKAGGPHYLGQFMNQRTFTENTLRRGFAPSVDPF